MSAERPPRYRLGPRSTRGLMAGWRGGQIGCVAVGAAVALGMLRSVGGLAGAVLALLVAGLAVAVAVWPVGGRTIEQWIPTVVGHLLSARPGADRETEPWLRTADRPRRGQLARLTIRAAPESARGDSLGILEDAARGTWTAVLPVGGSGTALLDDFGRSDAASAWSGVLSALAAEARDVRRIQWIARTYPALLDDAPLDDSPVGAGAGDFATQSYEHLVGEAGPHLWAREVLLAVTVGAPKGSLRRDQQDALASHAGERMAALLDSLRERLRGAGLTSGHPLGVTELSLAIRRSYDVKATSSPVVWPWPTGIRSSWKCLQTDATWQATYWIAEWPRGEVGAGFLLPLLVGGGGRRSVAMTMAPLPAASAVRRAERERTSGAADAELRRRHGFAMTARARLEQELRHEREAELADGHAGYSYSGYVTVTATGEAELESACSEVEQAAALSQLDLRRLYGAQEAAWCCTLPTGRGCG